MDGTGDYHAEWSKPVLQRQVAHVFPHLWKQGKQTNKQINKKWHQGMKIKSGGY
jgi:hypothetical protein